MLYKKHCIYSYLQVAYLFFFHKQHVAFSKMFFQNLNQASETKALSDPSKRMAVSKHSNINEY